MSGRCSATLAATPLAGSGERAFSHWLDSEQWASELKAAVPRLGARGAVLPRSPRGPVIQSLGFGWVPAAPAGTGRGGGGGAARARARPRGCFAEGFGRRGPKRGKATRPAPLPVLPPSSLPRRGEGGGGGKRASGSTAREREGRRGRGRRALGGARPGRCSPRAVPRVVPAPAPGALLRPRCPSGNGLESTSGPVLHGSLPPRGHTRSPPSGVGS